MTPARHLATTCYAGPAESLICLKQDIRHFGDGSCFGRPIQLHLMLHGYGGGLGMVNGRRILMSAFDRNVDMWLQPDA